MTSEALQHLRLIDFKSGTGLILRSKDDMSDVRSITTHERIDLYEWQYMVDKHVHNGIIQWQYVDLHCLLISGIIYGQLRLHVKNISKQLSLSSWHEDNSKHFDLVLQSSDSLATTSEHSSNLHS